LRDAGGMKYGKNHNKDKNGGKCGGFQLTVIHINFHKYQPI
jgi:hypothetical protein